jgi:glycosyltransferase involved in cell wall biosynthesis
MPKVILISQFPLPYSSIGSWTTMYRNYLENKNDIDIIICEKPDYFFESVSYQIVGETDFLVRLLQKITKKKHLKYTNALDKIIKSDEQYIIQIIDNYGLAKAVQKHIEKRNIKKQCYLQFFYHGFPAMANTPQGLRFYEHTDEIIVLTKSSYQNFKTQANVLPSRFSILNNGIDTDKFYTLSAKEKGLLKEAMGYIDQKVFIWCSQDRPKKGLSLILDVWKRIHKNNKDCILLVIGCEAKTPQAGVKYLGKIPNDELPKHYQIADVYLFPTLCLEGFGMTLVEALHCGCYCIASALGGISEVLEYGKLGKLIENPHFIHEWVEAIEVFLSSDIKPVVIPSDLYSAKKWQADMNAIISQAKLNLEQ